MSAFTVNEALQVLVRLHSGSNSHGGQKAGKKLNTLDSLCAYWNAREGRDASMSSPRIVAKPSAINATCLRAETRRNTATDCTVAVQPRMSTSRTAFGSCNAMAWHRQLNLGGLAPFYGQ